MTRNLLQKIFVLKYFIVFCLVPVSKRSDKILNVSRWKRYSIASDVSNFKSTHWNEEMQQVIGRVDFNAKFTNNKEHNIRLKLVRENYFWTIDFFQSFVLILFIQLSTFFFLNLISFRDFSYKLPHNFFFAIYFQIHFYYVLVIKLLKKKNKLPAHSSWN